MRRKHLVHATIGLVALAAAILFQQSPASAADPYPTAYGPHIWAYQAEKCLNDPNSSLANGTKYIIYTCVKPDVDNQDWNFRAEGNPYYNIWNAASSKCLTVENASVANSAAVIQYTCTTGANEEWYVVYIPGYDVCDNGFLCAGSYNIINKKSEKCLTVKNGGTLNGNQLVQYECNNGLNQLWVI